MFDTICSKYFWKQGFQMIDYIQACGFNTQVILTLSLVAASILAGYWLFEEYI